MTKELIPATFEEMMREATLYQHDQTTQKTDKYFSSKKMKARRKNSCHVCGEDSHLKNAKAVIEDRGARPTDFLIYAGISGFLATAIGGLMIMYGYSDSAKTIGIFVGLAMGLGAILFRLMNRRDDNLLFEANINYHASHPQTTPAQVEAIWPYLLHFIDDAEREMIGEETQFLRLNRRLKDHLQEATTLRSGFEAMINSQEGDDLPQDLQQGLILAMASEEETMQALGKMENHEKKIRAFFEACRRDLRIRAEGPITRLALAARLAEHTEDHAVLMPKVDETIMDSMVGLVRRLDQMRDFVALHAEETGVYRALSLPMSGNLVADTKVISEAVERFVSTTTKVE